MFGFIKLKDRIIRHQRDTGEAIIRLSKSVNEATPGSEWVAFKADPKAWLHKVGYRYEGPGAGLDGQIPAGLKIVPVYDTEDTMHVRIPWKGLMDNPPAIPDEQDYTGAQPDERFPVLLARYFMRRCR